MAREAMVGADIALPYGQPSMAYQNQIGDAKLRREVARKRRFADLGGKLKSTGRQRGRHPLERRRPRRHYVKARRLF